MPRPFIAALALLALALAGCTSPGAEEVAPLDAQTQADLAAANAAPPAVVKVEPTSGTVGAMAAGACVPQDDGYACCCVSGHPSESMHVSGNATGTLTFTWDAPTPQTERMHVGMSGPRDLWLTTSGASPLTLTLENVPSGNYEIRAWFAGVADSGVVAGYAEQSVAWAFTPAEA